MLWIAPESWGRGGRGRQKGDVRTVKGGAAKKFTLCPRGGPSIVKEPRAIAPFLPEPAHSGRHRCTRTRPSIESLRPRAAPRRPTPHPKPLPARTPRRRAAVDNSRPSACRRLQADRALHLLSALSPRQPCAVSLSAVLRRGLRATTDCPALPRTESRVKAAGSSPHLEQQIRALGGGGDGGTSSRRLGWRVG